MPPAVALCSSASPLSIPALVEHYPSACLLCLYPSFPLAVPVFGTSVHPFLLISVPLFFENILSLMTLTQPRGYRGPQPPIFNPQWRRVRREDVFSRR